MPSAGSITKTIRINAEDKAIIEELMAKEALTWSGAVHRLISEGSVPKREKGNTKGVPDGFKEAFKELSDSVKCYNLTGEAFLEKIITAMDKGKIVYEGGEFTVYDEIDLSRFKAACDEKGVEYQKMIDKCTQMVWQI